MSVITSDDSAARSESAVDDSDPITMMNSRAIITAGRYSDAVCGMMLFMSPFSGCRPTISATRPIIPRPITVPA